MTLLQQQEDLTCIEVLSECDAALYEAELLIEDLVISNRSCEKLADKQAELIAADKVRIEDLAEQADHSHIPYVAGTSAGWLLLLFLL